MPSHSFNRVAERYEQGVEQTMARIAIELLEYFIKTGFLQERQDLFLQLSSAHFKFPHQ
jgi:hypothetical protein